MKPFAVLFLFLYLCVSNTLPAQTVTESSITAIQTVNVWPISIGLHSMDDTIVYFFRNDTSLIRTSYLSNFTLRQAASNGDDSIVSTIRYRYFMYKKGEKKGHWLEDYQPMTKRFNENDSVEAVLKTYQGNFSLPLSDYIKDSTTFIGSKVQDEQVEKIYVFNTHRHIHGADTAILRFGSIFRQPNFLFYNYAPTEDNQVLNSVRLIIHCDEAIQRNMPEFAFIKTHHYLSEVASSAIAEAEKYFSLFKSGSFQQISPTLQNERL